MPNELYFVQVRHSRTFEHEATANMIYLGDSVEIAELPRVRSDSPTGYEPLAMVRDALSGRARRSHALR